MKTEILKMLKETPDFLSGQQLCEGLGEIGRAHV